MSNSAFKREEAKHHNEQYEAKLWREKNGLPEWANVPANFNRGKSIPVSDMCPEIFEHLEKSMEADSGLVILEDSDYLDPNTNAALRALGNVTLTPSIPMSEALQATQEIHRPSRAKRENDVVVVGAGSGGGYRRGHLAFATPEMLGEIGREQAREQMRQENGVYGKGF